MLCIYTHINTHVCAGLILVRGCAVSLFLCQADLGLELLPIIQESCTAHPLYPELFWSEQFQYQNIMSRAAAGSSIITNYPQGHYVQTRLGLTFGPSLRMQADFEEINLSQDEKE